MSEYSNSSAIRGVLLVTTPQQAALQVTRRGAVMFQKLQVPIVGLVQNMSSFVCPECQHKTNLYGDSTEQLAKQIGVEIIQDIPLNSDISSCCDLGRPIVIAKPKSLQAESYKNLAFQLIKFLKKKEASELQT